VTRFGLTDLLSQFLGLNLEKGPQKADWGQRPLTPRMTAYAEADARYLKPLQEKLRPNWSDWGARNGTANSARGSSRMPPASRRPIRTWSGACGGSHRLDRLGLAVLRSVWRWREEEAIRANRPTFHILNHDPMVDLAEAAARWGTVPHNLPRHLTSRRRQGLIQAVEEGLAVPPDRLPERVRHEHKRMPLSVGRRAAALRDRRDQRAVELNLDPSFLASRSQLLELADLGDWTKTSLMRWQAEQLV
jgi:ribonuclease D